MQGWPYAMFWHQSLTWNMLIVSKVQHELEIMSTSFSWQSLEIE